jgi:hypothetical protein
MRQALPVETSAALRKVAPVEPPMYQIWAAPLDGFCQTRSGVPSALKSAAPTMRHELPVETVA